MATQPPLEIDDQLAAPRRGTHLHEEEVPGLEARRGAGRTKDPAAIRRLFPTKLVQGVLLAGLVALSSPRRREGA